MISSLSNLCLPYNLSTSLGDLVSNISSPCVRPFCLGKARRCSTTWKYPNASHPTQIHLKLTNSELENNCRRHCTGVIRTLGQERDVLEELSGHSCAVGPGVLRIYLLGDEVPMVKPMGDGGDRSSGKAVSNFICSTQWQMMLDTNSERTERCLCFPETCRQCNI